MARLALLILISAAACGHGEERRAIPGNIRHDDGAPVRAAPHGGAVALVAITEQGDAAVTVDDLGSARLWPALDGSRAPVPLHVGQPARLALAHAGGELVAAIGDDASGVELVRIAPDGRVRGRVQLPCEVACVQVIAIDDGVLVRRADQSIERYDAHGLGHGRVTSAPGQRVTALAARRGAAIALVDDTAGSSTTTARWLALGDAQTLRWGAALHLPVAVRDDVIALAPSHHRIATLDTAASPHLAVFDLEPVPALRAGRSVGATPRAVIGFADDDHVAVAGALIAWWRPEAAPATPDPWAVPEAGVEQVGPGATDAAVGDGLAVQGNAGSLQLTTPVRTRYLGWSQLAIMTTATLGRGFAAAATGTQLVWLDDQLQEIRETDVHERDGSVQLAVALDERHVATERLVATRYVVELRDLDHPAATQQLGAFERVESLDYDAALHVLAVGMGESAGRYEIDLARGTARPLARLHAGAPLTSLRLVDPGLARGVVAFAVIYDPSGPRLVQFRAAREHDAAIEAELVAPVADNVVAIDATGVVYTYVTAGMTIVATRDGHEQTHFLLDAPLGSLSVSREGGRIVELGAAAIVMRDAAGQVRWRHALWRPVSATFSSDERRVLVRTGGGFLAFDAASGRELARECGWGFGLHDQPPSAATFGDAPVCEDTRER